MLYADFHSNKCYAEEFVPDSYCSTFNKCIPLPSHMYIHTLLYSVNHPIKTQGFKINNIDVTGKRLSNYFLFKNIYTKN